MSHSVKKALDHFKKTDPILYKIAITLDIPELVPRGDHFYSLVRAITNQQLSGKAADTIYSRVLKLLPDEKLNASEILKIDDSALRSAGLSWNKVSYLKDLAYKTVHEQIPFESLDKMKEEDIVAELTKIKGIGKWSAEMFLMFHLCRPDIFSYGDLGLRNAIQKIYVLDKHPTVKEAEEVSIKWSPYRTYASRILWISLDKKEV
ncbi:MAG TPA: DNA-3-methyladenine glycosylase 2 family protein [Candidatus Levybacteria bacterium]|nr:DNA-3-methyladenine glycosylase 2 family protein [Candidatus Levybacteria bacterium]